MARTPKVSAKAGVRRALAEEKRARTILGERPSATMFTSDSFQNLALKLGMGADNALSQSTYGYYPVTRIRVLLEWIHRGSWLGGVAVDVVGHDMIRAGIEITSSISPKDVKKLNTAMTRLGLWASTGDVIKWGRLYGGSIGVYMIDGQDAATPLRPETITKGQFKGILPIDRWQLQPALNDLVFDPIWGMVPRYYDVLQQTMGIPRMRVHHTRCMRMEGIKLPSQQRLAENLWGLSVYERMYDRMVAFDSGTMGVAQSLYKSYIRYMKVAQFRDLAAAGGPALDGFARYINMIRKFQGIEGMTIIDSQDEFGTHQNQTFTGMSDGLLQLGQQLAGALQIPLVRLFGQSPAGLNATGESDLRTYYDGINSQQEQQLRFPLMNILPMVARSEGVQLGDDFDFKFRPLWQMTAKEKADTANVVAQAVGAAYDGGLMSQRAAMSELEQTSHDTGIFSNISPEDIEAAEALIPTTLGGVDPDTGELALPAPSPEEQAELEAQAAGGDDGLPASKKKPAKKRAKPKKKTRDLGYTVLGQRHFQDIPCVVEQPPGFNRRGEPCEGASPYGYISRTTGMDGDNIDCFFGPDEDCFMAWVINQGEPDPEHKVMLGYSHWSDALEAYSLAYPDATLPQAVGIPMAKFKQWLDDPANHGQPMLRAVR